MNFMNYTDLMFKILSRRSAGSPTAFAPPSPAFALPGGVALPLPERGRKVVYVKIYKTRRGRIEASKIEDPVPQNAENSLIEDLVAQVTDLSLRVQDLEVSHTVPDSLLPALARGREVKAAEFAKATNLTLEEAARAAHKSDRSVNEERIKGQWYALLPDGKTRGYRYPEWQFNVPRERLLPVLQALRDQTVPTWAQHRFLTRPSMFLPNEAVPSEVIANESIPIEIVLSAINNRFRSDQGGS